MDTTPGAPTDDISDIEQQAGAYPARVTRPRRHTRPGGTREIVVDRVFATGDDLETIRKGVTSWLKKAPPYRSARQTQQPGDRMRRYAPGERRMTEDDIRAASLIKHHLGGDHIGALARDPRLTILTKDGRRYETTTRGEALQTCRLCKLSHEPFTQVARHQVHPACIKKALREEERQESMSRAERILEKASS